MNWRVQIADSSLHEERVVDGLRPDEINAHSVQEVEWIEVHCNDGKTGPVPIQSGTGIMNCLGGDPAENDAFAAFRERGYFDIPISRPVMALIVNNDALERAGRPRIGGAVDFQEEIESFLGQHV
ncbi:MAG: hypothetical protein ACREEM_00565 [Blastocatellia bacterium]